jgi:dipeptidyl aminopeptidase/acylaminoacyl peptidase
LSTTGSRFPNLLGIFVHLACAFFLTSLSASGQSGHHGTKRPITVADAIETTRLVDRRYSGGRPSTGRVAHFSPNGQQFVVLLKKGNLKENTSEFSLLLFQTSEAFHSPKPALLLRMSSSSNRDAIKNVNWLEDNETVAFLGENPGQVPQVYTLNVRTKRLVKLTSHPAPIGNYAISANGQKVLFVADPPMRKKVETEEARRNGIVITTQPLLDVLAGDCSHHPPFEEGEELFMQAKGQAEIRIPIKDLMRENLLLSLSPSGRYAIFAVMVRDVPKAWEAYQEKEIHELATQGRPGVASRLKRLTLLDTAAAQTEALLDAPVLDPQAKWRGPSETLIISHVYLPLDVSDAAEREARQKNHYTIEFSLASKDYRKLPDEQETRESYPTPPLDVILEEDITTPPVIYVRDFMTGQKVLLFDLNPQFQQLLFGRVETVEWKTADGGTSKGALYLPPDYTAGKRYPLVIQTHGFHADRFSMDGLLDWASGFAARPLASKGIVVLQSSMFADDTNQEAHREMLRYEGAIDYLDGRGLIDRDHVGIVGFSRTFFTVGYTLTHSEYRFSAAILLDGIDAGYFQYLAFSGALPGISQTFERLNGGPPFGETLSSWLKNSPSFHLDKIRTPLRIVALSPRSVLSSWEWFSALSRMRKPVDLIYLPDAEHIIVKPWEQMTTQESMVDWYCFWLKGEEDPDPAKASQYVRLHEMRLQYLEESQCATPGPIDSIP